MDKNSFVSEQLRIKQLKELGNEKLYRSLFTFNTDPTFIISFEGLVIDVNQASEQVTGYRKEELVNMTISSLIVPEDLDTVRMKLTNVRVREPQVFDTSIFNKHGQIVQVSGTAIPIVIDNQVSGIIAIAKDVTEQNMIQSQLQENEEQLRTLINSMPDFVCFKDGHSRWLKANRFALSTFGLDEIVYKGKTSYELSNVAKFARDALIFCTETDEQAWTSGDISRMEEVISQPNGHSLVLDVIKVPVFNPDGSRKGLVIVGRDITKRKIAEELNSFLAHHDSLTQLPNRRLFEERLQHSIVESEKNNQKFAIMYLDLDRFKYINDTLGTHIGDVILKEIATRLKQCTSHDTDIFRIGGDEFLLMLPHIPNIRSVLETAQLIIDRINETFWVGDYELYLTTSIGISTYPTDGLDAHSLIRNARAALYHAENNGRNQYEIYASTMNIDTYKKFLLNMDLHNALDQQELELYYQPYVNANTGKIIGVEALLRWNHPEWGMVSPEEFIPLAEETGLILPIGDWTMLAACKETKKWQDMGLPAIPVSVNISAQRLMQKDLIKNVESVLRESGLDPKYLKLEITETSLINNMKMAKSIIDGLNRIGVNVILDDFGTGYSSLAYLNQLQFSTLKLDRSFIKDIEQSSDAVHSNIISAVMSLAQSLNIDVIAEGVETLEQLQMLRQLDCEQIQGYLYSKPVPLESFTKQLSTGYLKPSHSPNESKTSFQNKRQYFRVNLQFALGADMTIVRIKDRNIELGNTEVLIEDIGIGGLRFLSNMQLSVHPDIILEFETVILQQSIKLYGHVVWKRELQDEIYQYGLQFSVHEKERDLLAKLLNDFSILLRKNPLVPNCRFIKLDKMHYFRLLKD